MDSLTGYIKKAFEYKDNGDYKEAIDFFYKALALDNESIEIMLELADLYAKLSQYDRAFSFYEQVISKNSTNYLAKFEYAVLLKKLKEYEKAIEVFEELYQTTYKTELVAEELFSICAKKEDFPKIISYFNLHSNNLNSSENLYYVANAYENLGKTNLAEEYYEKAFKVDSSNSEVGAKLAEIYFEKGEINKAEEIVLNLLKYAESDKLLYLLAEIYYAKGNYDNSLKYYSYAIKNNPQNALYYFHRNHNPLAIQ